jgi:hypothetical protein
MAPLFLMVGTQLFRAAGKKLFEQAIKAGAKKATQKQIAKGGAQTLNNSNAGLVKTLLRPKSGGGATKTATETAKKTSPKTSGAPKQAAPKPKPKADAAPKPSRTQGRKKKAPELKPDPKNAPDTVKARAAAKKQAANKKPDIRGDKIQRGLLVAVTAAPLLGDGESKDTAKADTARKSTKSGMSDRKSAAPVKTEKTEQSFGQAFKEAYDKGVGTKFSHKGKDYVAVKDSDVKKAGAGSLRDYLNKKSGKAAKGMYASKNNKGANDYRMGGMLMSVEDRRKMK